VCMMWRKSSSAWKNGSYPMDPQIVSRFNEDILQAAMRRYHILADQIELLDGFENL